MICSCACMHVCIQSGRTFLKEPSVFFSLWLSIESCWSQNSHSCSLGGTFFFKWNPEVCVIMERWQMDFLRVRRKGNETMLCKYICILWEFDQSQENMGLYSISLHIFSASCLHVHFPLLWLFICISRSTIWNFIEYGAVWQQSFFFVLLNVLLVHMVWHGWAATVRFWSLLNWLIKKINLFL